MRHFKSSLGMCFPHKMWVKEWQTYHNKHHDKQRCKDKYVFELIVPPAGYIYDDKAKHKSFVCNTANMQTVTIQNWLSHHLCVDGGLIRYGKRNYMEGQTIRFGRCDSIVFDNNDLWFIELKMDVTSTLDIQLWRELKGGMRQISDFMFNIRFKMSKKRTPLEKYFTLYHQHCAVCMKTYPKMNTARNNYLENFRIETGVKLSKQTVIP